MKAQNRRYSLPHGHLPIAQAIVDLVQRYLLRVIAGAAHLLAAATPLTLIKLVPLPTALKGSRYLEPGWDLSQEFSRKN